MMPTKIFVETLTGKTVPIEALPTDTINDIKGKVARLEGIPVEEQMLAFNGEMLDVGDLSLDDIMIPMGSTLFLKPMRFSKPHMIGVRLADRVRRLCPP